MATTQSPNAVASALSKSLKRPVTAKAVRTMARSIIARFDKTKHPAYQSHEYSAAEVRTLTTAMSARGSRTASAATAKVKARATRTRKATPAPATVASSD